jgi:tetratricopeptide (TPR) repeat protein
MSSDTTESTLMYDFLAWLEVNKKRLAVGGIALFVLGFAVSLVLYVRNEKEIRANDALLKLGLPQASDRTPSVPASAYLKVAAEFAGTHAGARAQLLAAIGLFSENRYAEALAQFKKFKDEYPNDPAATEATLGMATCEEAQGNLDEALKTYQLLASGATAESAQAKLGAARLLEAKNQPDQALKYYNEITQTGARSVWGNEARILREQLLVKYPRLASAAAPPAVMTPPAMSNLISQTPAPKTSAPASRTNNVPPAKATKP